MTRNAIVLTLALVFAGCAFRRGTLDYTANRPFTCEVHRVAMSAERVTLGYGMKAESDPIDVARLGLFPHADEPYETGYCLAPREKYARVFVCSKCTKARAAWIRTFTTTAK